MGSKMKGMGVGGRGREGRVQLRGARGRMWLMLPAATLGAIAALAQSSPAHGPSAHAASTLAFNVNSNLHLIGRPGHVLNEKGTFSGSQSGTIAIRFTSVTSTSGGATFAAYSSAGSISGQTTTKGHVVGAKVYFTGVMSVTGGSGRYAHAYGRNLQFSGVVDRRSFHATTHMQGSIRY
ncbi:MAG TPA: hypothetical protein VGY76_11815 [Solirubrobacteraceae bacterium]|nr:hypothetical protein [Solirubrobacteraceae bacterium]